MTTSRETILTAADNFGFAVQQPALRQSYTRITLDSERVLAVSFDRNGRIRSAMIVTGDVPRAIRPATVEILHDEMRAAYAAITVPAAELIAQTETLLDEIEARQPAADSTDIFDELDRQYAAADRFEVDPQNRGSIGPRIPSRDDIAAVRIPLDDITDALPTVQPASTRSGIEVCAISVDEIGPEGDRSIEVGTWSTEDGAFEHTATFSREEAEALLYALGRILLG